MILALLVSLLPAVYVHVFYAMRPASAQRLGLLEAICGNDPVVGLAKIDALHRVSFDSHYWRLMTLRNPWKIYPAELAGEIARVA